MKADDEVVMETVQLWRHSWEKLLVSLTPKQLVDKKAIKNKTKQIMWRRLYK